MKRIISLLLCLALLAAAIPVCASAEELRFYRVRIDAGNGVNTENAILADDELYIPADSFGKYTRYRYDGGRGVFLIQGQEYDKAFKTAVVDVQSKRVTVGEKQIELTDCFGPRDNPYLPLCQMLPILNAQLIDVDGGVLQIVNNELSMAELLYDFDLGEYLFDPSEEFFGDIGNANDYVISSYVFDTVMHGRVDRIFSFNSAGLRQDYQALLKTYLSDTEVYHEAMGTEDHAGSLLESITGLGSATKPLDDVNEWFQKADGVEDTDRFIEFIRRNNEGSVFEDDLGTWVDVIHGEHIDLGNGVDFSYADIMEGISWIYSFANQVEDHRDMLDAVYEISEKSGSDLYSRLGDPEFLAAKKVYDLYGESILTATGLECSTTLLDKVSEAAIEKTRWGFYASAVALIGEIMDACWEGDSGERALLMHHLNIMDTARRAASRELEQGESVEDYRLALLLALMASRAAYQTMAENGNGYERYRARYEERIEAIEEMMKGLYLVAENHAFDSCAFFDTLALCGRTVLKGSGVLNELAEAELERQMIPMIEYGILLGALSDAGVEELSWDLADGSGDGVDELYIEGYSGAGEECRMLFDADTDYLWSVTDPAVAGSASWVRFEGENGYVYRRSHDTADTQNRSYDVWHENGWENLAGYVRSMDASGGYSDEYRWLGESVTVEAFLDREAAAVSGGELESPELLRMDFTEGARHVQAVLDAHFRNRAELLGVMDQDLDGDGVTEHLYLIDGAANRILGKLEAENVSGRERHLNYEDEALTIISVEEQNAITTVCIIRSAHYDLSGDAIRVYDDLVTINRKYCSCGDGSGEWVFEIPQIDLDSGEIEALNAKILADWAGLLHDCDVAGPYDEPAYWNVDCDYTVAGDILSIVMEGQLSNREDSDYGVYNVSLSEKMPVPDETLIAAAGMTEAEYRTHVRQALGSVFWYFCGHLRDAAPGGLLAV